MQNTNNDDSTYLDCVAVSELVKTHDDFVNIAGKYFREYNAGSVD